MSPGPELETSALDTTVAIETPEHIAFRQHLAGPTLRGFAYLIDTFVRGLAFVIFALIVAISGSGVGELVDFRAGSDGAVEGLTLVALFALEWGYFAVFEALWNGQTPGKRALGIRVVRVHGEAASYRDAVLRNLLRAADILPSFYALGIAWMGIDRRQRRLGDLVAGTMVVLERREALHQAQSHATAVSESELSRLPQRPALLARDAEVLDRFVRRRHELSAERAVELAAIIAPRLARQLMLSYDDPDRFIRALHERYRQATGVPRAVAGAAKQGARNHA